MPIVRFDPFRELRQFARTMERAFDPAAGTQPWGTSPALTEGLATFPPVDVYEDREEIVFRAELPGMEQKNVELMMEDSTLTIRGERKLQREEKRENYQRIESSYGSFSRSFSLPSTVDSDNVRAEMKNGVLEVHVPKREGAKGKSIPIRS